MRRLSVGASMLRRVGRWFWQSGRTARAVIASVALAPAFVPAVAEADTAQAPRWIYFTGADLWRGGASFHGGLRFSPGGVDQDGFTLKALLASGTYEYLSGGRSIRGVNMLGAIMPGWHFVRGKFIATIYAGPEIQNHRFIPDDFGNRARGTHFGLRAGADLWWEPNEHMMVATSLNYATTGNGFWARTATGWRVLDKFWIGPEAIASGERAYQQYALGLHVTGLKYKSFEWTLAGGVSRNNDGQSGLYGRFGLLTRR